MVGLVENFLDTARQGEEVIVDGVSGSVVIRPSHETRKKYPRLARELEGRSHLEGHVAVVAYSSDGARTCLMANIDHPIQTHHFLRKNLEGTGLFRTESLVLEHGLVPREDEQFRVYTRLIGSVKGARVVIRTIDIGADKNTVGLHRCSDINPALGVRGIR